MATGTDTLSLHDALPILIGAGDALRGQRGGGGDEVADVDVDRVAQDAPRELGAEQLAAGGLDRKSTRLNSSHGYISYAVFCLKKNNDSVYKLIGVGKEVQ